MGDIVISEVAKDLIINIINILVLFLIIKALVYKPVKKFLAERTARVEAAAQKAQEQLKAVENADAEAERIIADAEKQSEEIIAKAQQTAHEKSERIIERAKAAAAEEKEKTLEQLKEERRELIEGAREDIAELAVDISERILCREVSARDNQKIVDDFFAKKGDTV